jgi:predicted nucleic acid-binding protein
VVTGLLDTAVLVDLLRSYEPSRDWLAGQPRLGIVPIVWLEIIQGAENLRAQKRAVELLRHFERVDLEPADFDWAIGQALRLRLSHSVDVMDCVIAAAARRLDLPLYTRNLKHFEPMLGSLARKPY